MARQRLLPLLAVTVLAVFLMPTAQAEPGHCLYKQYAPKLRVWYPVCQMPAASKADCEALISANKAQVEYADGECSTSGVAAVCELADGKVFFYAGGDAELKRGCEDFLRGVWRADLVPKG